MNIRVFVFLVAGACVIGAQPPQGPPPPPIAWWENPIGNGLELTDAQRERVARLSKEFNDRLVQKRASLDRAEQELNEVFNANTIDWERARTAIDQLANARRDMTRDLSWMTLRMRDVLTLDQWKTLEARRQNPPDRRGKGRGRGYRGPGGSGYSETKQ
jgi:Spy/CpxP family protein refolding chaperone